MTKITAKMAAQMYPETPEFTAVGKRRIRQYQLALGRFVDMFSEVETAAMLTLWQYAGTTETVSRIVFGGVRADQALRWSKQIAAAAKVDTKKRKDLDHLVDQFGIINGARNDIVHYGAASIASGNAIVTNAARAKGEPTAFPVSPKALSHMTDDLQKIAFHLYWIHCGRRAQAAANVARARALLRRPWRYKHLQSPKGKSS